jgi:hypothetical protein
MLIFIFSYLPSTKRIIYPDLGFVAVPLSIDTLRVAILHLLKPLVLACREALTHSLKSLPMRAPRRS